MILLALPCVTDGHCVVVLANHPSSFRAVVLLHDAVQDLTSAVRPNPATRENQEVVGLHGTQAANHLIRDSGDKVIRMNDYGFSMITVVR